MGLETKTKNYVVGEDRSWATIKYTGVYDIQQLLSAITNWFGQRNYLRMDEEHTEKVGASGNELKVIMAAVRKVSWYVQFMIKIDIEVMRNIDVLVAKNEDKEKQQHGEIDVRIKALINKNYKNTFKDKSTSKFQEFLRRIYERFIIPGTLKKYRRKLAGETESLIDEVKRTLGVKNEERTMQEPE
ncbi:MAG: hypothetical protein AABW64_02760 [Nanoarchaeota archaeon]